MIELTGLINPFSPKARLGHDPRTIKSRDAGVERGTRASRISRARRRVPESKRPPRGGLFDSGTRRRALLILLALVPRSTPASLDLIVRGSCPRSAFGLKGFINPVSSI